MQKNPVEKPFSIEFPRPDNPSRFTEQPYVSIQCVKNVQWFKTWQPFKLSLHNHVKTGGFSKDLVLVVDTGYGLGRSLGDCKPALPKGRKYQMVETQTQSHVRRPVV